MTEEQVAPSDMERACKKYHTGMRLISSQGKEFFVLDPGHIGLLTGSGARRGIWPKVRSWLERRSG